MLDAMLLGLGIVFENKQFDNLILMDGDGEDRPVEIKSLLTTINEKPNCFSCC